MRGRNSLTRPTPGLSKNAEALRRYRERLNRRLMGRYALDAAARLWHIMRNTDGSVPHRDQVMAARTLLQAGQRACEQAEVAAPPMLEMLQRVIDAELVAPKDAASLPQAQGSTATKAHDATCHGEGGDNQEGAREGGDGCLGGGERG